MKKIGLYLDSKPSSGGAFQYGLAMLDAVVTLPSREYEVLITYSSSFWKETLKRYDVESCNIPLNFYERNIVLWWRRLGLSTNLWRNIGKNIHPFTRRFMQQVRDLWIFPSQDIWSYRLPVPALCTIHDLMHRYEKRFPEVSAYGRYERREAHYRDICKWSVGILVDSNVGKQQVVESYEVQPEKVHVLPYVPPKYIYENSKTSDFNEFCLLPRKFIFYPAQFWSHKNHHNLIKAVQALKSKLPDLKLVFVGAKKNSYNAILKLVCKLGLKDSILFLGYVPDKYMVGIYRRARAMVMPTFFGPTNVPPLEAFAVGCPVAVSNIYGMPEQVGDAALLFDPNRVDEIATTIFRLWTDDKLCQQLSDIGKKRSSAWSQHEFNEQLLSIIRFVLKQ